MILFMLCMFVLLYIIRQNNGKFIRKKNLENTKQNKTITMKTLIAFVFTIFFIISCANCVTTISSTSGNSLFLYPYLIKEMAFSIYTLPVNKNCFEIGYKIKEDIPCRYPEPCNYKGEEGCIEICNIWGYSWGHCRPGNRCCCVQ